MKTRPGHHYRQIRGHHRRTIPRSEAGRVTLAFGVDSPTEVNAMLEP
jgi:hypothetical protein